MPNPTLPNPTNPDPTNPDPTNPDPTNPDPTNPDPTGPEATGPEATKPAAGPEAPAPAPAPATKTTERPHPLTPLVRGWVLLFAGVIAFSQEFLPGRRPRAEGAGGPQWWWFLIAVGVVALLVGLASILTWYFTRFVIDDDELRIETGFLNRSSKRIGFSRIQSVDVIQPFAARLFGLSELRIEAGGGDSAVTLRYLKRDKSYRLRDYLLSRAHGHRTTVAESDTRPRASILEDLSAADRVLVRILPPQLIIGLLTSLEFIISVLMLIAFIVVSWRFGWGVVGLGAIVPFAMGVFGLISRRVVTQFNYTLAETGGVRPGSPTGLRITRGLTNLTSQSVPLDRVQGVRIRQSWLWRRLKLHRVDISVLGYGEGENNERHSSTMLFPVATTEQVRIAMAYLLPDAHDEAITLQPVSPRAIWLRPFTFRTLRWGANDRVAVSEGGLLVFVRDTVPHAKTQSVRITQGPLQRRLGIASVHIDTTPGPVACTIPHLPADTARLVFDRQLPLAADARRRGLTGAR